MPAWEPQDCDHLLAKAFNEQDLAAAVELYEPAASVRRLAHLGGEVATGDTGIREVMAGYVGLRPHMDLVVHHVTRSGDIAVLRSQWRITGTGADGAPVELTHHGIEVVRQQPDGTWKFVIDHPYGADPELAVPFESLSA
ncbi:MULTISPECIES: nuclear transport factor 2 family protein [unclassified Crossiella]|uniref:YybH family protein n=1 Tax=unclassified Crossiella TaxID=2620835 RepID=UPI001FFFC839|nr:MULTISPECIES: nuclear transport factor 2 family protein [unclassified Crossiella]MCK2241678.1 nuclear transport factor 2 family protein [Crossiella sp. S99.2]MCK2255450.1 nuclear transport factor 2 family protein [Crossiella sp. S99.1]